MSFFDILCAAAFLPERERVLLEQMPAPASDVQSEGAHMHPFLDGTKGVC